MSDQRRALAPVFGALDRLIADALAAPRVAESDRSAQLADGSAVRNALFGCLDMEEASAVLAVVDRASGVRYAEQVSSALTKIEQIAQGL
jgi:hypothetical protein